LNLSKTIPDDPKWWRKAANTVVKQIKKRTAAGKDWQDKNFDAYSDDYAKRKATGKLPRQASAFASKKPNLILSSDMLNDLKLIGYTGHQFIIGWAAFGSRVKFNEDNGRAIIGPDGEPIGNRLMSALVKSFEKEWDRGLKKWASNDINLTIG
jgi:hypothetical protein